MQEVVQGEVSLYGRTVVQQSGNMAFGMTGSAALPVFIPTWHSHNELYVARPGQEAQIINQVSLFKGFKNRASEYFDDCPVLVEQLQERELKKEDLREIVELYNSTCGRG